MQLRCFIPEKKRNQVNLSCLDWETYRLMEGLKEFVVTLIHTNMSSTLFRHILSTLRRPISIPYLFGAVQKTY